MTLFNRYMNLADWRLGHHLYENMRAREAHAIYSRDHIIRAYRYDREVSYQLEMLMRAAFSLYAEGEDEAAIQALAKMVRLGRRAKKDSVLIRDIEKILARVRRGKS